VNYSCGDAIFLMEHRTTRAKNPYIAGPTVTGKDLFGREEVIQSIMNTLSMQANRIIVLYGQRRMGKTSVLYELHLNRLPQADDRYYSVFFDLQGRGHQTEVTILYNLATSIAKVLDLEKPSFSKFEKMPDYFERQFLPLALEALGGRRLVCLFDEFDSIPAAERENIQNSWDASLAVPSFARILTTGEMPITCIFAISRHIERLPHIFSQFLRYGQSERVGLLSPRDAKALIVKPAKGVVTYEPEVIEAILDLTAGHPYFTQLLCFEIFERLLRQKRTQAGLEDLELATERSLEAGKGAFAWLWRVLSDAERLVISTFSEATNPESIATTSSIIETLSRNRIRLGGMDLSEATHRLVDEGVLSQQGKDGYRFSVDLVRLWIQREHPIYDEKGRIEDLSSIAMAHYRVGRRQYEEGKFDQAIYNYQSALNTNPNHLSAQLGLARTFRELDRLPDAVDAFEDAFWLSEVSARDELAEARLALGEQLEVQGNLVEANLNFRRVAEIAPHDRRLNEKLQIPYEHGLKAVSIQRWQEAGKFFKQVVGIYPEFSDARQRLEEAQQEIAKSRGRRLPVLAWVGGAVGLLAVIGFLAWGASRPPEMPTPGLGLVSTTVVPQVSPLATVTLVQVAVAGTPTSTPSLGVELSATPTPSAEVSTLTPSATLMSSSAASTFTPTPSATPTPSETPTPFVVTATPTPTPTAIPLPTHSFGTREALDVDIDPLDPRVVYAVAKGIGIFKSTDAGGNWKQIWPVEGVTPGLSSIESLTIHPSDPKLIFAAGYDGILKSEDGGGTWREVLSVADSRLPIETQVHAIALVPNSLNIAYAATDRGVFKSFDGGLHWDPRTQAADGEILARPIYTIAVASQDDRLIYAAGQGDQIYRSEDGVGTPWQRGICSGCGNEIYVLAVDPSKNNRLYAGGSFATFAISDNGGSSWAMSNTGLSAVGISNLRVSSIAVSPQDSPTLFAGTGLKHNADSHGIYRRQDSGQTWTTVNSGLPLESSLGNFYVQGIAIGPTDSQIVYLAGFGGVYKSTDGGDTWSQR
jgi:tetratricopeptide (TPR) repeat protein/photosystem II stability/assembly factor-like uncharacterized protein